MTKTISEMIFFEEVKAASDESHKKWFERYFKKYNIEKAIKASAQKGYTGHLINVLSVKDEYTQRRLNDERTISALQERLGNEFKVKYELFYSRDWFKGQDYVSDKKISISWK